MQLRAARADDSQEAKLQRFATVDLLLVDDLGLRGLTGDEPIDLYEEWAPLFNDTLLASAAMDRRLHHAHVIENVGNSYRNPPRNADRPTA